jgi:hypothetical protein
VDTDKSIKTESDREREEMETQRRRHRVERKRLQQAAVQAQEELRHLRPLRSKVEGLRAEAERLRNREAELVQARDRAVARARVLESANADLERECRESRVQLARLMPPPEPEPEIFAGTAAVDEPEPPVTPLAGRAVFFFTGELRRSSAEATAQSLRALGADEIRTFCLRQGSDGPDVYPPEALVVVDIRFLGHSQSGMIEDRAARSGAQFLAVRSGKGSLARTVARELAGRDGMK